MLNPFSLYVLCAKRHTITHHATEKINSFKQLFNSMNGDDFWASVGTALSAIGATISWLYSYPIVSSLFTFIVGAFVTFLVQSKLQDRSEKRRLRVKAIEELYIPLYLRFEEIKEKLLLDLEPVNVGSWNPLLDKPQMFTVKHDSREQIVNFFKNSDKLEEKFRGIEGIAVGIIFENARNRLFPALIESGLIKLPEKADQVAVETDGDRLGFSLYLERKHWSTSAPILPCGILNRDPIDYLEKKYLCFEADKLMLSMRISYLWRGGRKAETFRINLTENAELLKNFWKQLTDDINNNPDIRKFNSMRQELIPICDGILNRLRKHIETYIKTEKI